ncbi:hypothetical protein ALC62_09645 [Cyphomyrmex costatus]|uniref:Uncharacterized protein n=1 Tax=Cyphomyrmex costatus TaxID=456900 RepID=A0A151IFA9_9HYME|nr:hypothetical protein ALC62_09645 [Cyphomyrmex costatus]
MHSARWVPRADGIATAKMYVESTYHGRQKTDPAGRSSKGDSSTGTLRDARASPSSWKSNVAWRRGEVESSGGGVRYGDGCVGRSGWEKTAGGKGENEWVKVVCRAARATRRGLASPGAKREKKEDKSYCRR